MARRHLRPDPGSNAGARQLECGTDVSGGGGKPCRVLPKFAGAPSGRRRNAGAVDDTADRGGASAAVRLSASVEGPAGSWDGSQSQAGVAADAGRQSVGRAAQAVRGDDRLQSHAGNSSKSGPSNEADGSQSAVGGRYYLPPGVG